MPETDTIPVSASIVSTGLGIRYIGNWAYAFSGKTIVNSDNITFLDFTTGNGFIVAQIEWGGDGIDSGNVSYQIDLNGENVMYKRCAVGGSDNRNDFEIGTNRVQMLIPPLTRFELRVENSTASNYDSTVWLSGRVYGVA